MEQIRQSNYELLRLFSIILIILMHGIRSAYISEYPINEFCFNIINTFGNMAVTVFMLISGFFGIQFRIHKLVHIWGTVLIYSMLTMGIGTILLSIYFPHFLPNYPRTSTLKFIYTVFTPIGSNTYWFITSYIIIYCLSPFVNKLIELLNQRQLEHFICVLMFFYILFPTFLLHSLSGSPNGKSTSNLLLVYIIGRYIALFGLPSVLKRHIFSIFITCILVIYVFDAYVFDKFFMCKDHNLFILISSICVFNYFGKFRFSSKAINKLASYCLQLYVLDTFLFDKFEIQYIENINDALYIPKFLLAQTELIILSLLIAWITTPTIHFFINSIINYTNYIKRKLPNIGCT